MKALFEYNPATGEIQDSVGLTAHFSGMIPFEQGDSSNATDIDGMIKLKNAGFTAAEIIEMKKAGVA